MRGKGRLLALLLAALTLAGCWDVRDVNDRTGSLAVGFDRTKDGGWRVIFEDVLPKGGEYAQYRSVIRKGNGKTIADAFTDLQASTIGELYLGSTGTYVLGQSVLQSGAKEVIHFLLERAEVTVTSHIVGSTQAAEQVLTATDENLGAEGARFQRELDTRTVERGYAPARLWEVGWRALTPGVDLYLPLFIHDGSGLKSVGTAMVRDDRGEPLVLGPEDSVTFRWLLHQPTSSRLTLPDGTTLQERTARIAAAVEPGAPPRLKLTVKAECEVYDQPTLVTASARYEAARSLASRVLVSRVIRLVTLMKKRGVDPIGFADKAAEAGVKNFDFTTAPVVVQATAKVIPRTSPRA